MRNIIRSFRNAALTIGLLIALAGSALADLSHTYGAEAALIQPTADRVLLSSQTFADGAADNLMQYARPASSRYLVAPLARTKTGSATDPAVLSMYAPNRSNPNAGASSTGTESLCESYEPPQQDLFGPPNHRLIIIRPGSRSLSVACLGDFQITEPAPRLVPLPTPGAGLLGIIGLAAIVCCRRRML